MGNDLVISGLVALVGLLAVAATVLIHYEGLRLLQRQARVQHAVRRRDVMIAVLGVLSLHGVQIIIYGLLMWWVADWSGGAVDKQGGAGLFESMYLSALTYSTLGQAPEVAPTGPVRMLVALESLAGLLMITWSATFTYHRLSRELERSLDARDKAGDAEESRTRDGS